MTRSIREAKAPFGQAIFVCSKCARKLGRGAKGKSQLRGALKRALKRYKGRTGKVRVTDVGCLDLCPKGRQVLATGRGLARGRLLVIDKDVSAEAALERILDDGGPAGGLPTDGGRSEIKGEPRPSAATPSEVP